MDRWQQQQQQLSSHRVKTQDGEEAVFGQAGLLQGRDDLSKVCGQEEGLGGQYIG